MKNFKLHSILTRIPVVIFLLLVSCQSMAFNVRDGFNTNISSWTRAIATQPDGKILVGGGFLPSDAMLMRLNPDGSPDATFDIGTGPNAGVFAIAVQSDGKILVAGRFDEFDGNPVTSITRLNADGSYDEEYNSAVTIARDSYVTDIEIQEDGKVVFSGDFTTVDGDPKQNIARLNVDGTLDRSFNVNVSSGAQIYDTVIQPNGKIILAGSFASIDGVERSRIARVDSSGKLDSSFNPGAGANAPIFSIAQQPDGKIVLGGRFTVIDGINRDRVGRLNLNGSLDTEFLTRSGPNNRVDKVVIQRDGKILIGGRFTKVGTFNRSRLARLLENGSVDVTYFSRARFSNDVLAIALQPDDKAIVGGAFETAFGESRSYLVRLENDGFLDRNISVVANGSIQAIAIQSNGKILIGGNFRQINGIARNRIARINRDGSVDPFFDPGTGANLTVFDIAVQTDGRILIAGAFTTINGIARNYIARLTSNGRVDNTFDPGTGPSSVVTTIATQGSRVLIAGLFSSVNGVARSRLAMLNYDGSLTTLFIANANGIVSDVLPSGGGSFFVVGAFSAINGVSRNRIAKVGLTGAVDSAFDANANGLVTQIVQQTDGKLIVAGSFTEINGVSKQRIARLNVNGSLDTSFNTLIGFNDTVFALALDTSDNILVGGDFTFAAGRLRNRLARLERNGALDSAFNVSVGFNGSVDEIVIQDDGKILTGGDFTRANNFARWYFARVSIRESASQAVDSELLDTSGRIKWLRSGVSPKIESVYMEGSINGLIWEPITAPLLVVRAQRIPGGWSMGPRGDIDSYPHLRFIGTSVDGSHYRVQYRNYDKAAFPDDCDFFVIPFADDGLVTICL